MMGIAVISDIHANVYALKAVLRDIDNRKIERIVSLGDVLYGPIAPVETYRLLLSRRMKHIRGNSDRGLLIEAGDKESTKYLVRNMLHKDHLNWINGLPTTHSSSPFFFCHGTPYADNTYLLYDVRNSGVRERTDEELAEILSCISEPYVICGHSHLPGTKIISKGNKTIINVGSVGLPAIFDHKPFPHKMESGNNNAKYTIIEEDPPGSIVIKHVEVPYSFEKAASKADSFDRGDWAYHIRTGRTREL